MKTERNVKIGMMNNIQNVARTIYFLDDDLSVIERKQFIV